MNLVESKILSLQNVGVIFLRHLMYTHHQETNQANSRPVLAQGLWPRNPCKPFAFLFKRVWKGYGLVNVGREISEFMLFSKILTIAQIIEKKCPLVTQIINHNQRLSEMKILKITAALALIANVCVANSGYNNTLDKGYSGLGISFSSISGDLEGNGVGFSWTTRPGNQNFAMQTQFNYLAADEVLGTDVSALDVEAYNLTLGLGYIFELSEMVHLVPNLGYLYTEYGVLGYEASNT